MARLEAFSDGVFSIAITLLVLEIHVPPIDDTTTPSALVDTLLRQWPSYIGRPSEQVGVVVYAGAFAFTAIAFNLLWFAVKRVLKPGASAAAVTAIDRSFRLGPPVSLAALVISFVFPTLGIIVISGLVVLYLLPRSSGT